MASTITSTQITTFVAGTTISSSEVNNNFGAFRGDFIPINTNTSSSSNLSHGLGVVDHRWKESFLESIKFGQTTTSWSIQDDTTTVGNFVFKLNGATVAQINSSGFIVAGSALGVTTATANFTASITGNFILADASIAAFTITLPTAVGNAGRLFDIKKVGGDANQVTIDGDGTETIDGSITTALVSNNELIQVISDNANWRVLKRYNPEGILTKATGTVTYPISTGEFGDLVSISVPPGLHNIRGQAVYTNDGGVTTATRVNLAISKTAGNTTTGLTLGDNWAQNTKSTGQFTSLTINTEWENQDVVSITTYYLKAKVASGVSNLDIAFKIFVEPAR